MAMEKAKKQALKEGVRAAITPWGFVRGMTKTIDRLGNNSLTRGADRILGAPANTEDRIFKGVGSTAGKAATAIRGALSKLPSTSTQGRRGKTKGMVPNIYPAQPPVKNSTNFTKDGARKTRLNGSTGKFMRSGVSPLNTEMSRKWKGN